MPAPVGCCGQAYLSIVHAAMTGCTQHDQEPRLKAFAWRFVCQMKEVMNFAIPAAIALHEAISPAQLAAMSAGSLDFIRDAAGTFKGLQDSLHAPEHDRAKLPLTIARRQKPSQFQRQFCRSIWECLVRCSGKR